MLSRSLKKFVLLFCWLLLLVHSMKPHEGFTSPPASKLTQGWGSMLSTYFHTHSMPPLPSPSKLSLLLLLSVSSHPHLVSSFQMLALQLQIHHTHHYQTTWSPVSPPLSHCTASILYYLVHLPLLASPLVLPSASNFNWTLCVHHGTYIPCPQVPGL